MNISASSPTLFTASTTTVSAGVDAAAPAAPVQDTAAPSNEGTGRAHGHGGHGNHGHLRQALNEALQGLGLSGAKGGGDHDGDDDGGAGNVKHDIAQFMHALFQAVKGETAAAPAATGAASAGAKGNFAAGLSALITEAGSGTVPKALQDAFNKLAADFHLAAPPVTAAPAPATPAAPADPVPGIPVALPGVSPAPISLAPAAGEASLVVAAGTVTDTALVSTPSIDPSAAPAAATSAPTTSTGTSASTPTALTLQALLSRLQQALGYGSRSGWSTPPTGNTVNLTA